MWSSAPIAPVYLCATETSSGSLLSFHSRQRGSYSTGPAHHVPGFHLLVYRETINKIYMDVYISSRSLGAEWKRRKGRFAKRRQKFTMVMWGRSEIILQIQFGRIGPPPASEDLCK